jgi:putative ABC transport system permease protein
VLRDARRQRRQVLAIALLLALGVGMYAALSSMSAWRVSSADKSFAALQMHDLRLALAEGSTAREGTLRDALHAAGLGRQVTAAAERLVLPTQIDASSAGRTIIVPGRIVGTPAGPQVDTLDRRAGRLPAAAERAVALEYHFAKHYELPPSGVVTLAGGGRVAYSGQALAPQYFVVTAPGADFGAESAFAVMFASLRTAQALTGERGRVNELVLRLRDAADRAAAQARLTRALRRALPGTGFTFTARADEPAHRLIYKDAEGDQQTFDIFAFLLLGAAAFAAFNLISRTVEAQRREIGIGMALGVEPRVLARRPFLLGGQIALLGVVLGIPVGLAADVWLKGVMSSFFPLPVIDAELQTGTFAQAAALGLLVPLLATALPVWRAVRVAPVDAIRVGARAARSSGAAGLLKGVRLPGGSLANLPLRNVLRTPRRTIMTLLGIAAIVTIVVALSGMIDAFDATLSDSRREALAGAPHRLTVDLTRPERSGASAIREVADATTVGASQVSLRLQAKIADGGKPIDVTLEAVYPRATLWRPTLDAGRLPAGRPGLVIARRAADDLHVAIGDRVAVLHPVPTGPETYQLVRTRLAVTGIHTSPFRFVAYTNPAGAAALGVGGLVNRVSVVPAAGRSVDDVKAQLLRLPDIAAVQGASAMADAVDEQMAQFTDVLIVTVLIAGAMALLIAFNASSINADERAREHATMFAYGVPVTRVLRGNVAEAVIVGALGTAVGIAAGLGLLRWTVSSSLAETMPDVGMRIDVSVPTYLMAVAAGTLLVGAAPLLAAGKLRRTDVPSALRVME